IVLREIIVFFREKERLLSSVISPLLFLFVIGRSININYVINGYTYQQYIFAGIIAMNILFTTIRYGLYLIWDKRLDFLKEVLVAPISRTSLFFGKVLGGIIGAVIEMLVILIAGNIFVLKLSIYQNILIVIISFACGIITTSIGLTIGALMKTMEGFALIMSLVAWPMFLFSNALFDIRSTSRLIKAIAIINPLTYFVDLLRKIAIGYSAFNPITSIYVIILWILATSLLTIKAFEKMDIQK
ncbi:MAG: ABC transporter permease, partial [Elusimicrobiales bacterium]